MDFSPGFEGANEPGLLFQAMLNGVLDAFLLQRKLSSFFIREQLG